jgi:TrmH family RNA methyltransferase
MASLTSWNNPKIKQIRQLLVHRKEREATGLFVTEGIRHVGEAVDAKAAIEYICYSPGLLTSDFANNLIGEQIQRGVLCLPVDQDIFTRLAGKDNPQGLIAVIRKPDRKLADLSPASYPWCIALVAPQDPGNIGAILRTIDAVGASGLVLLDDPENNQHSTDPYHPSCVRASMGSIFWYPPVVAQFSDFPPWTRNNGIKVFGTSAHAAQDYRQVDSYKTPLVLLMGSEREGLTASQAAAADVMLKLPMHGRVTSLNLAIATGVMLYAILAKLE